MKLQEWTLQYIKFKNHFKKNIKKIKEEKNKIIVNELNKQKIYYVMENLDEDIINQKKELKTYYVTLNKKSNIKILLEYWNIVETKDNINFIFVNPETNEKWIIHPMTHSKISESKSIKTGINTLYESIKKFNKGQ